MHQFPEVPNAILIAIHSGQTSKSCNVNDPTNSRYRYLAFKSNKGYRRYVQEDKDKPIESYNFIPSTSSIPSHGSYGSLLFDNRWKAKRIKILTRDKHRCVICQSKLNIQVHHRQYHFAIRDNKFKPPWAYDDHLLISLCETCHKRGHNKFTVPTIII